MATYAISLRLVLRTIRELREGNAHDTMALVSASPYLSLLSEKDLGLKTYALTSLIDIVDQLWAEIANKINELEELYEDKTFERRELAALVISKVYYNLGDFDEAVKFSLLAGEEFNINEHSQYVETIVSECIKRYSALSQKAYESKSVSIDKQLEHVFERMVEKCVKGKELKLALGICLESYRLDLVNSILQEEAKSNEENALGFINYILACSNTVSNITVRTDLLRSLISFLRNINTKDFFTIFKIIVQLNESSLAVQIFEELFKNDEHLIAYQGAFDLVNAGSQQLLDEVITGLSKSETFVLTNTNEARLLNILSGVPTCDLDITFLYRNINTDISILNKTKNSLEGRSSIFHSAVTFANAFMHAGTTEDSFFRKNLEWLGKATSWSKFSATAALGVIHKGNLSQGRNILKPYLPGSSGSAHTKGGSLFALGLIFAGHGRETIDYLKLFLDEHGNSAGNKDTDVILHGACLGSGVAGMATNNESLYEELKVVLFSDSATSGQAAGLAMGLVMLGSGNKNVIDDMFNYAKETKHENIIRSLAIGIALVNFGREKEVWPTFAQFMDQEDPILRYGGVFTIALAFAGTGDRKAIKKLLHYAVSDPSDDVRRASVLGLGFLLIRDYTSAPQIVELLSQSHNPHVRYGTAMALGIACAGRGLSSAIEVLEPLTKDPVDFVRQGAHIATAMILIQQNEHTYPKVKDFVAQYANTIKTKHEDALAKFGATLAQGIIDAGGRNVTISLEHSRMNTLNNKAIVGLAIFVQSWYWYPLAHFLCLSFVPTSITGVRGDLKVPKFQLSCHVKPEVFEYPPKTEELKEKQPEKMATAVLSTTAKAKARAKKNLAKKQRSDSATKADVTDSMDIDESGQKIKSGSENEDTKNREELVSIRYSKTPYKIDNLSRVLPAQANYVSFTKDSRYVPVRKFKGVGGIIVLKDTRPDESTEFIKTVRQLNITEAPLPEPFVLSEEDIKELEL